MKPTNRPATTGPLRAARERAGLSLDALAERAGISRATLWNAEQSPARLSDKTANAVAAALGIDPKELRRMSLSAIDVTYAVPWVRAEMERLPPGLAARRRIDDALSGNQRFAATTGVLGAAPDPEDPRLVGQVLALALGADRRQLASGAWLATTERGRRYVLGELPSGLAIMTEIEWRLGRGDVEIEVYARPPEVIQ